MLAADHLARLMHRPLDEVNRNGELLAEGLIQAQNLYRADFVIVFADVYVEAEALGVKLAYSPTANPHIISYLNPSDIAEIDIVHAGRVPEMLKTARLCRSEFGADFPVFYSLKDPFSLAAISLSMERFLINMVDGVDATDEILRICAVNQMKLMDAALDLGCIPLVGAPLASGSLIGPLWFERYAAPGMMRLFDRAEQRGSFRCLHICGDISVLEYQISHLRLDLFSFEQWYAPLWERMPNAISMGYVPTDLLARRDSNSVIAAAWVCLQTLPKPGILSTACDVPADADSHLIKAMMSTSMD